MKIVLLTLFIVFAAGLAFAETTSGADWAADNPYLEEWLNSNDIDHRHEVTVPDDYESPIEVGAKVLFGQGVFAENQWFEIDAAYDVNNETIPIRGRAVFDFR